MRKAFNIILTVVLLLIISLSPFTVSVCANHECTNEDCAICGMLQTCRNLFKLAVITFVMFCIGGFLYLFSVIISVASNRFCNSLFNQKTKLSN